MSALAIGRCSARQLPALLHGARRGPAATASVSAPGVLAEPFASFGLGAEGRPAAAPRGSRTRLLHLGGLHGVSDCWRCWLRPAGAGSRRMLQKSNCPAAGMKCRGHPVHRCGYTSNKLRSWCHHGGGHYPSSCGCRTSGLHTKAVTAGAAPGISCSNPAHELGGGEHGAMTHTPGRV